MRIRDELFFARLDCFVDLSRDQKGAHMSRFDEVVNEAIGEVVLSEAPFAPRRSPSTSRSSCASAREPERAEVTIAARYPEHKPAPVSGIQTQEIYTLHGRAVAFEHGRGAPRRLGDGHDGMPLRAGAGGGAARERLPPRLQRRADRANLEQVPVATHNQRGLATLHIGCMEECAAEIDAKTLLAIAEASMSSEIYELMKRSDEVEVVEKAHRRPRFVEDCVREMVAGVFAGFRELDGGSFVSARQENLETIHQHNVFAERHGLLCELRQEIELGTPGATRRASSSGSTRRTA